MIDEAACDLQILDLKGNNLTDEHVEILAPMFASCKNLERLDLRGNNIGARGLEIMSNSLPRRMERIDLSCNNFGDREWEAVCKLLTRLNELIVLHLSDLPTRDDLLTLLLNSISDSLICLKCKISFRAVSVWEKLLEHLEDPRNDFCMIKIAHLPISAMKHRIVKA